MSLGYGVCEKNQVSVLCSHIKRFTTTITQSVTAVVEDRPGEKFWAK